MERITRKNVDILRLQGTYPVDDIELTKDGKNLVITASAGYSAGTIAKIGISELKDWLDKD